MKTSATIFTLLVCISAATQNIKPLKIGDTVPDIQFTMLSPDGKKSITNLSDYKGKLVILDFWATWCGICVGGFLKADSLQKIYDDKIQILLVNSVNRIKPDNKVKLNRFYQSWMQRFPEFELPFAVEDTLAYSLFLHSGIPHYVWISQEGKVVYTTSKSSVTAENINKLLTGQKLDVKVKDGYKLDALYMDGITPLSISEIDNYSFFKKGKLKNVNSLNETSGEWIDKEYKVTRVLIRNQPLIEIYKHAIRHNHDFNFPLDKRLWIEVKDKHSIEEELYSYDLKVLPSQSKDLFKIVMEELNRYTNYEAGIEMLKVKCLVLVRTSIEDRIKSKGDKTTYKKGQEKLILKNLSIQKVVTDINRKGSVTMPVLNETNYTGNVDMEFSYYGDDIQKLRKELQKYDLDLIEAEREIEMFVIRDKVPKSK